MYGGAIYFDSNNYHINILSSTFYSNTAGIGGGAILSYSNNKNINILYTKFIANKVPIAVKISAGYNGGGAIFFSVNNHTSIYIYNSTFISNNADFGIFIISTYKYYYHRRYYSIITTTITTTTTTTTTNYYNNDNNNNNNYYYYTLILCLNLQGGTVLSSPNATIVKMTIDKCFFQYNTAFGAGNNIIINHTLYYYNRLYCFIGGVFELRNGVYDSSFTSSYYISNVAGITSILISSINIIPFIVVLLGYNGGAIRIRNNSVRVIFRNNTFIRNVDSTAEPYYYGGADIAVYASIDTLIENNTMIEVLLMSIHH